MASTLSLAGDLTGVVPGISTTLLGRVKPGGFQSKVVRLGGPKRIRGSKKMENPWENLRHLRSLE